MFGITKVPTERYTELLRIAEKYEAQENEHQVRCEELTERERKLELMKLDENEEVIKLRQEVRREKDRIEDLKEDFKRKEKAMKQENELHLAKIAADKERAEEEIKHAIKFKSEMMVVEMEKFKAEMNTTKSKEIAALNQLHQDKITSILEERIEDVNKKFSELLERLPNVNMRINDSDKRSRKD